MSKGPSVFWNQHERITSDDLNVMSSLGAKLSLDLATSITDGGSIVHGLTAFPAANGVTVRAGSLMTRSAVSAPVPPLDASSDAVPPLWFAENLGDPDQTFTMPVEGNHRWVLVEVRVVQDADATAVRDIRDVGTGLFGPALVSVRRGYRLEFRTRTSALGAVDLPGPDGFGLWAPVCGFRTIAGGGIPTELYDLRRTMADLVGDADSSYDQGHFSFRVRDDGTFSLYTRSPARARRMTMQYTIPTASAENISAYTVSAPADGEWWIYLSAVNGIVPKKYHPDGTRFCGVLSVNNLAPTRTVIARPRSVWCANTMVPVPPFSLWSFSPADSVLVGHVRHKSGSWVETVQEGNHVQVQATVFDVSSVVNPAGSEIVTFDLPTIAETIDVAWSFQSADRMISFGFLNWQDAPKSIAFGSYLLGQPNNGSFVFPRRASGLRNQMDFYTLDSSPAGGSVTIGFATQGYWW